MNSDQVKLRRSSSPVTEDSGTTDLSPRPSKNIHVEVADASTVDHPLQPLLSRKSPEKPRDEPSKCHHDRLMQVPSRRIVGISLCVLILGFLLSIVLACANHSRLPFSNSNLILMNTVDVSHVVDVVAWFRGDDWKEKHRYFYWKNVETPQGVLDCTFDLRSIVYEGGQSRLYQGDCKTPQDQDPSALSFESSTTHKLSKIDEEEEQDSYPVVLKSMKRLPVFHEAGALRVLGEITDYLFFARGFNFLVATELRGYRMLGDVLTDPVLSDVSTPQARQARDSFLKQCLEQINYQLKYLHREYYQLDVTGSNILFRPSKTQNEDGTRAWDFQLIDFSTSRPLRHRNLILKAYFRGRKMKMPALAHYLTLGKPAAARAYLQRDDVAPYLDKLCPDLIDTYGLGGQVISTLHYHETGEFMPKDYSYSKFDDVVDIYESYMQTLDSLTGVVDDELLDMVAQITDLKRLNPSFYCRDDW